MSLPVLVYECHRFGLYCCFGNDLSVLHSTLQHSKAYPLEEHYRNLPTCKHLLFIELKTKRISMTARLPDNRTSRRKWCVFPCLPFFLRTYVDHQLPRRKFLQRKMENLTKTKSFSASHSTSVSERAILKLHLRFSQLVSN